MYVERFAQVTKLRDEYAKVKTDLEKTQIDMVLRELLAKQKIQLNDPGAIQHAALQKAFDQGFNSCLELIMGGILNEVPLESDRQKDPGASADLQSIGYTQAEIDESEDDD